jgi:hypothetical protein
MLMENSIEETSTIHSPEENTRSLASMLNDAFSQGLLMIIGRKERGELLGPTILTQTVSLLYYRPLRRQVKTMRTNDFIRPLVGRNGRSVSSIMRQLRDLAGGWEEFLTPPPVVVVIEAERAGLVK